MAETNDTDARFDEVTRYVLGELEGDEVRAFEARLANDPALANDVRRLRATFDLLPYAEAKAPPRELRDRVLREAAAARPPSTESPSLSWKPSWSAVAALAASIAAILLAYDGYQLRQDLTLQRELSAMMSEPNVVRRFELAGVGDGAGAFGAVSLDLDDEKGAIALRDLPTLPDGSVYTLWALVDDKSVPCGDFRANATGEVLTQFAVPVDSYTAPIAKLFVTIEPRDRPDAPTGPTVLESV